jgi:hypothetical protein
MKESFDAWQQLASEQVRQQHAKEGRQQGTHLWQPQRRHLPTTSPATTNCERRHVWFWFSHPALNGTFNQGALLAPMNIMIMKQNTVNEQGQIIPKGRLTHDQNYAWRSRTSGNSYVWIKDLL